MKIPPRLSLLLLFLIAIAAGGCTTTATFTDTAREGIGAGRSVIFGRLLWMENGEERRFGVGLTPITVLPQLVKLDDATRTGGELDRDGFFLWTLEKGTYIIGNIRYGDAWSGNLTFAPRIAFRVPENGKAYSVGTLKAEFEPERDLANGISGPARFSVVDTSEEDMEGFRAENANVPPEKSLMVHDPRLPGKLETLSDFTQAARVLVGR
jgi:hypothetical protein